jgi:4-amino-4-deoxy-L-arabinose transferase-like glycosyltransferase
MQTVPRAYLFAAALAVTTLVFVTYAASNLDNYPPVSGDEPWIMSASHKLATEGVLGTDLFGDFLNYRRHWFPPPGQFVLQAGVFRLFGAGVAQARWVSLMAAVIVLWVTGIVAWRWYGWEVAAVAVLLLLLWRSRATMMTTGIPLLGSARSARYDMTAAAAVWLTVLVLEHWRERRRAAAALATGLCAATATLSQFYGILTVALIGVYVASRSGARQARGRQLAWMALGFALLTVPYGIYVVSHWSDAVAQFAFHGERASFYQPGVMFRNLVREPLRYVSVIDPLGPGSWTFVFAMPVVLVHLTRRALAGRVGGDRSLLVFCAVFAILLALVDTTKAPIYSLALVPAWCVAAGATWVQLLRSLKARRSGTYAVLRWGLLGASLVLVAEGSIVTVYDRFRARDVSAYEATGRRILELLPQDGAVLGAERWWWPLRSRNYVSLSSMLQRWHVATAAGAGEPELEHVLQAADVSSVVISRDMRGGLSRASRQLQAQFDGLLRRCTRKAGAVHDRTYGEIAVHELLPSCRA